MMVVARVGEARMGVRRRFYFSWLVLATVLAASSVVSPPSARAESPIAYVGYEDYAWKTGNSCCKWLNDSWNRNTFRMPLEGDRRYLRTKVTSSAANEGRKSLSVMLRQPPTKQKQRIEFEIANNQYYTQYLEDSRFYGVALYIPASSPDVLGRGVVFMQAWQRHETAKYSKEPVFSLRFADNSAYKWAVNVSRDGPNDTRFTPGTKESIYTSPTGLAKGVWHEFIVWFKPSVKSSGAVRVWHNGSRVVSQTNARNFGYAPRASSPWMSDDFAVRYGAYKTATTQSPGGITLLFDQGKFGTSYEAVDP